VGIRNAIKVAIVNSVCIIVYNCVFNNDNLQYIICNVRCMKRIAVSCHINYRDCCHLALQVDRNYYLVRKNLNTRGSHVVATALAINKDVFLPVISFLFHVLVSSGICSSKQLFAG
jgi:hypothetical protein